MPDVSTCYCYFAIKGDFDPQYVTERLSLMPEMSWAIGDCCNNGTKFDFALWEFHRTEIKYPECEIQCIDAIRELIGKEDILIDIKNTHDVSFVLEIVPSICNGEKPVITFGKEVIKFCYLTDTDIDIDMYVYPFIDE